MDNYVIHKTPRSRPGSPTAALLMPPTSASGGDDLVIVATHRRAVVTRWRPITDSRQCRHRQRRRRRSCAAASSCRAASLAPLTIMARETANLMPASGTAPTAARNQVEQVGGGGQVRDRLRVLLNHYPAPAPTARHRLHLVGIKPSKSQTEAFTPLAQCGLDGALRN